MSAAPRLGSTSRPTVVRGQGGGPAYGEAPKHIASGGDLGRVFARRHTNEPFVVALRLVCATDIERCSRRAEQSLGIIRSSREGSAIGVQRPIGLTGKQESGAELVVRFRIGRIASERFPRQAAQTP